MQLNGDAPALDYLEALRAKQRQVEVTLGGQKRVVRRARLGLALQLFELQESSDSLIDMVLPYVAVASGVPEDEIELEEVSYAFKALFEMNRAVGLAALARFSTAPSKSPPAFDYKGRGAAAFVHEFAVAYGWTADYTLDEIGPEEAWCYVQEIEFYRHEERSFAYSLSSVGRDKHGKQKTVPEPPWFRLPYDQPSSRRKGQRPPPPAMRPTGTIIDLNKPRKRRTA